MTHIESSFKERNWLMDFLLRFFGWSYNTKASGKSPKMHNWRRCPNSECNKFIWKLSINKQMKCRSCGCILIDKGYSSICILGELPIAHDNEYCKKCDNAKKCVVGKYFDNLNKKRIFCLNKPLYNPLISIWFVVTAISIIFVFIAYQLIHIFNGFENTGFDISIWSIIWCNFWYVIMCQLINLQRYLKRLSKTFLNITIQCLHLVVIFFLTISVGFVVHDGVTVIPRWREIPTQAQWRVEQQRQLGTMQSGVAQFEVSLTKGGIDATPYFIDAAVVDFAGLMNVHGDYVTAGFNPRYGKVFYGMVQEYLRSLSDEELGYQCKNDPWNVLYTPMSAYQFSEYTMKICRRFLL